MKAKNKSIFIVAGEPSGDLHASNLAHSIKQLSPDIKLYGMGGKKMRAAGVKIIQDITSFAVIGFTEVFKNLIRFRQIFKLLKQELDKQKPSAVVLIDYPGFNLRFAKEVKKRNIPLFYYISPQVWAWGKGRIKIIKKMVDKMIVFFKFEEELYRKAGVPVVFVGHPLMDSKITQKNSHSDILTIALLPGSRKGEVERILPIMLKTGKIISVHLKNVRFLISKSPNVKEKKFQRIIKSFSLPLYLTENNKCLSNADLVLVCSGTVTLEVALYQKPMFIIYKTSFLSALLAKFLIKIPYIGLINIVSAKKIVPEFIQHKAKPQRIAKEILNFIHNEEKKKTTKEELRKAVANLGKRGASKQAAKTILNYLQKQSIINERSCEPKRTFLSD